MDIQTAYSRCIDDLSLADNTARTYRNGLARFSEYLAENDVEVTNQIDDLTIDHFIYFLAWLHKSYSKKTCGVYASATKALLDWLVIHNYIEPSYTDSVRLKKAFLKSHRKHEYKLPRWPNEDDIPRMIEAAHAHEDFTPKRERDIALIEALASSGCRVSELIALDIQDIDLERKSAIVIGKGSKERRVFFNSAAIDAFKAYWKARKSTKATDPVFTRHDRGAGKKRMKRMTTATARDTVNEIAMVAGIDTSKMSPHYFRHAFAIRVLAETGNIALAQDMLGHQDPKSTRVYAKIYPDNLERAHHKIFD